MSTDVEFPSNEALTTKFKMQGSPMQGSALFNVEENSDRSDACGPSSDDFYCTAPVSQVAKTEPALSGQGPAALNDKSSLVDGSTNAKPSMELGSGQPGRFLSSKTSQQHLQMPTPKESRLATILASAPLQTRSDRPHKAIHRTELINEQLDSRRCSLCKTNFPLLNLE